MMLVPSGPNRAAPARIVPTRRGQRVAKGQPPWERYFLFGKRDLQLLYLTRKIARLGIDRAAYRQWFQVDCLDDFPLEFAAVAQEGFLEVNDSRMSLTPRGMAKPLICLAIFLLPHLGQPETGSRSGFTRFERKLKIFRHFGQANS